jgi:hypothetical protein
MKESRAEEKRGRKSYRKREINEKNRIRKRRRKEENKSIER